ncbi:MAG: hypothetical protein AAGD86_09380, partial [Pseudomonadota bacterium]
MTVFKRALLAAGVAALGVAAASAGTFIESVFGDTRLARSLLRYEAVDSADDVRRLARVRPGAASDGLEFPDGDPIGQPFGEVQYNRGLPLYLTAYSRFRSGLYRWSSNAPNVFNTADLFGADSGPGLRSANVFGYEAPTCVGIRGNGPRLWAHFSSLARIVEEFGLIGGAAGGSSGSISVFVTESIHANPLLTDCDGRVCSRAEAEARMALWFKAVQGLESSALIGDVFAVAQLVELIQTGNIEDLLNGGDPFAGVAALVDILQDPDLQQILNPEILDLLLTSPDPVFHANDIVQGTLAALSFEVTDPTPLVRPGPINFDAFAEIVGRLGNFFAGYQDYDAATAQRFLEACAVPGRGLDWPAVAELPAG